MKEKLRQNIISRVTAMQDEDQMLRALQHLGLKLDETIFTEYVWATLKLPSEIKFLKDDNSRHFIEDEKLDIFRTQVKSIKLFKEGEWYTNRNFNIKVRPEWINIITE